MLSGPAFELYQNIMDTLPGIEIIASGGIATMGDILKLDEMGLSERNLRVRRFRGSSRDHLTVFQLQQEAWST
jgi:hypothetical protein